MTLVQNRPPRLSGNSLPPFAAIILVLLLTTTTGCELFKPLRTNDEVTKEDARKKDQEDLDPIQGRKVYDPETGTFVLLDPPPSESLDTIRWKVLPPSQYPPIIEDKLPPSTKPKLIETDQYNSEYFDAYNVAILLPFMSDLVLNTSTKIDNSYSLWSLNYYGGARMAIEELASENIQLNVSVLDTRGKTGIVKDLLYRNTDIKESHLIIGPYLLDNVKLVADYALRQGKVMVSPRNAAQGVSPDNPNYLQANATLQTHNEAIAFHAIQDFQLNDIFLVARDQAQEMDRLVPFQEAARTIYPNVGGENGPVIQEFIIEDKSAALTNVNLIPLMRSRDSIAFIVPSYADETFIISLLAKIELSKRSNQYVRVYGQPPWLNYERIDFDYFEKLNIHLTNSFYADLQSPEVQLFKQKYYDRYGALPTDAAYLGYDHLRYFGRMLDKYGTLFQYSLENESREMLATRLSLSPIYLPTQHPGEQDPIQQFGNKFVYMLHFQDYFFQKAR